MAGLNHDRPAGADGDIIEVLVEDHREIVALFEEMSRHRDNPVRRRQLADVLTAELIRHAVAEEEYLYPAVRRALPDGDKLVDRELADHAQAEETLRQLEDKDADDPVFDTLAANVLAHIRHHVRDEERSLFPPLRDACDAEELRTLGRRAAQAKRAAPTRRPLDAEAPPWTPSLTPGSGFVESLRSMIQGP